MKNNQIEGQVLPENLLQHELVIQFKSRFDESWQSMILPYLGFLLHHNHLAHATALIEFVQDMEQFSAGKQFVALYLSMADWSEKLGTSLFTFIGGVISCLQGGRDLVLAQILHDTAAVKSWIYLVAGCSTMATRILSADLTNDARCVLLKSPIVAKHSGTPVVEEDRFSITVGSLVTLKREGIIFVLTFKYYQAVEDLITKKVCFNTVIKIAEENAFYIEELLGILLYFTENQQRRLFAKLERDSHLVQAALHLFRLHLRLPSFNIEPFIEYIEHTELVEKARYHISLCSSLRSHTTTVIKIINTTRVMNKKLRILNEQIAVLKSGTEKIPQRYEKMQSFKKQMKKLSSHWTLIQIHNKDTIGRCIHNFFFNDLELLRYLIDIMADCIADKCNHHLIPSLFRLAVRDRATAIKLCQLLLLEKANDRPIIFAKLLIVLTKNPDLFDNLITLSTGVATSYHGMLRLNAFYQKESPVNIDEMEQILQWMNENPHAALQLSLFLTLASKEADLSLFPMVILLCKKELTQFLRASQQFTLTLELHCRYLLERRHQKVFDQYYTKAIDNANKKHSIIPYHLIINYDLTLIYANPKISSHVQQILHYLILVNQSVLVKKILNLYQQDSDLAEMIVFFAHECSIDLAIALLHYINHANSTSLTRDQLKQLIASQNHEILERIICLKRVPRTVPMLNKVENTVANTTTISEEQWSKMQSELEQFTKLYSTEIDKDRMKIAQASYLALIIANLLISEQGYLNIHLMPEIKKRLLQSANTSHLLHLQGVLQELADDSDLQNQLLVLQMPAKIPELSAELIRITLNLNYQAEVTLVDFKRAILTSLLVHLRQEHTVGSCVGTSAAISCKTQLKRAIEIATLALSDSQCTLESSSNRLRIRFYNKLNSTELNSDVYFDPKGELKSLEQKGLYLWQLPWLIRLGNYLNISQTDFQSWIRTTIENHKNQFHTMYQYPISYYTSKRTLIKLLVAEAKLDDSFVAKAQNAVLAETQNPIVRVMESILLGGDYQKQAILQYNMIQPIKDLVSLRISLTLTGMLVPNSGMVCSLWRSPLIRAVANLYNLTSGQGTVDMVMRTLTMLKDNADIKHIPLRSITLRQLLNTIHESMQNAGSQATPTKEMLYKAFLRHASLLNDFLLDKIQLEFCNAVAAHQQHEFNPLIVALFPNRNYDLSLVKLVSSFLLYVEKMVNGKSQLFLESLDKLIKEKIIIAYNHDDGAAEENALHGRMMLIDVDHYDDLNPHFICTQEAFSQLYNRIALSACEATLDRQHPLDNKLSKSLLQFINSQFLIKSLTKNFDKRGAGKPWKMTSGGNPNLAWTYSVAGSPSFARDGAHTLRMYGFYPRSAADVLAHYIQFGSINGARFKPFNYLGAMIPGHAVSAMLGHTSFHPIWRAPDRNEWVKINMHDKSAKLSQIILNSAKIEQLIQNCANKFATCEVEEFLDAAKVIKSDMTLFELRKKILDIVIEIRGSVQHIADIVWQLDTQLLTILNTDQRAELTVLHIADTNWLNTQDHQDIHFCLLVSPLSLQVELWRCNQDGTRLQKEPQNKWLSEQQWAIYYPTH